MSDKYRKELIIVGDVTVQEVTKHEDYDGPPILHVSLPALVDGEKRRLSFCLPQAALYDLTEAGRTERRRRPQFWRKGRACLVCGVWVNDRTDLCWKHRYTGRGNNEDSEERGAVDG